MGFGYCQVCRFIRDLAAFGFWDCGNIGFRDCGNAVHDFVGFGVWGLWDCSCGVLGIGNAGVQWRVLCGFGFTDCGILVVGFWA